MSSLAVVAAASPFSEYMEWAKTCSGARFNLASSGIEAFPLAELGPLEPLEINGPSRYGYAPLQQALAQKAGVDPDRVVHATGTSMANLLALAATTEPGDEVLIEEPTYSLLTDAARWLRLDVQALSAPRRERLPRRPARRRRRAHAAHAPRRAHEPAQPLERVRARATLRWRSAPPPAAPARACSSTRCTSSRWPCSAGRSPRPRSSGRSSSSPRA